MLTVAEFIFSALLITGLLSCLALGAFLIVHFIFTPLIHVWFPQFGILQRPETGVAKADHHEIRLLALDMIIRTKIEMEKNAKRQLWELMNPGKIAVGVMHKTVDTGEYGLEDLMTATIKPMQAIYAVEHGISRPPLPTDSWGLMRYRNNDPERPEWLINKISVRGRGLMQAWAPIRSRGLRLDRASAFRWAESLGSNVFVCPLNAMARSIAREEAKDAKQTAVQ